jgi:hypothetical protein
MSATIISCTKQPNDNESGQVQLGGSYNTPQPVEKQFFQVVVAEASATPLEVQYATYTPAGGAAASEVAMPGFFGVHPIYTELQLLNKIAKREKGGSRAAKTVWNVECDYSLFPISGNTSTAANIKISVDGVKTQAYTQLSQDGSNTPIRNSVGDLYPDPIEITLYDEVISVSYESNTVNGDSVAASRGVINNGTVTLNVPQGTLYYTRSFAKHTLLFDNASYSTTLSVSNPQNTVWQISYQLVYRWSGWDVTIPDKGYRYFITDVSPDDLASTTIKPSEWKDHAEYLDGSGVKLASGAALVNVVDAMGNKPQVYVDGDLATLISDISVSDDAMRLHRAAKATDRLAVAKSVRAERTESNG